MSKSQTKTVTVWEKGSIPLHWLVHILWFGDRWGYWSNNKLHGLHFCVDNAITKKGIIVHPNNMPYITKSGLY